MLRRKNKKKPGFVSSIKERVVESVNEKYLKESNLKELLYRVARCYELPPYGKLTRLYDWSQGDMPLETDGIQWLIFFDYLFLKSDALDNNEWEECYKVAPENVRQYCLRWYLSSKYPLCNYNWLNDLPSQDYRFYEGIDSYNNNLVILYPYVFRPHDVPFLFDDSIPSPGSGKPGAFSLDPDAKAVAINLYADKFEHERFMKSISNENPQFTTYIKKNGMFYARILDKNSMKREWSTADVTALPASDNVQKIPTGAVKKMMEINARQQSGASTVPEPESKKRVHGPQQADDIQIVTDEGSRPQHIEVTRTVIEPVSAPPKTFATYVEANDPKIPVAPYANCPQEANKQANPPSLSISQSQDEIDLWNPDVKNIFPTVPLPQDGEKVIIGTGVTQSILGSGGMGVVFLTWVQMLEQFRALKLLKPPPFIQSPEEYHRYWTKFLREIKIQSGLHHGNIAQTHTFGEWNKYLFLEMEYVKGADAAKILKNTGRFDAVVALALVIQALQALNYAHNKHITMDGKTYIGSIHRDIKPANLMIADEGYLKILDFGIAIPHGMFSLTMQQGNLVGTAPYSSPEQINGRELDHRSDIYSTGTVLYELLTGSSAFGQGNTIQEVLNNVLNGNCKPVEKYNLKLPKTVKFILKKSMERDPDKRFESATAMLSLCNEALHDITREIPEAVVQDFVTNQKYLNATGKVDVLRGRLQYKPGKKKKFILW